MEFDFNKDHLLEDDRIMLTPLDLSHLDGLLPAGSQDEDLTFYSTFSVYTREALREFIQTSLSERENKIRYAFAIYDKKTGKFAGSTSFAAVSNIDQRLEIGYTWLGNDFQKTGVNLHCKYLLLQYIFEELAFERAELKTDERNQRSRTAIEKIGGKFEGILRSHILMRDGFRRSSVYYSILKNEWPEVKLMLENRKIRN